MLRGDDRCIEHLQRAAILGQLHIAEHLAMTFLNSIRLYTLCWGKV